MSATLLNIVIGLVTSIMSGGSVWLWQQAKNTYFARRKAAFFGLERYGKCLIVMNNKSNTIGSATHNDIQAMIEVATLASDVGCSISVVSCNEFRGSNGNFTEFCIGGPGGGSNPRTGAHLATHLPGVTIKPADPKRPDSMAIIVGEQKFLYDHDNQQHALIAKFKPAESTRPVIIIAGQTSIANRAAVSFLKREYISISKMLETNDRFCIIVRIDSIQAYSYQASKLAADVSGAAFSLESQPPVPARQP